LQVSNKGNSYRSSVFFLPPVDIRARIARWCPGPVQNIKGSKSMSAEKANKPVFEIRQGTVKIALWENQSSKGAFLNATVSNSYQDDKGAKPFLGVDVVSGPRTPG
jgi:hypothetical protein